ncbi:hypothetical protein B0H16DRAFT_1488777 [Mycena metata]|uniref:HIT domain-containing protein n=1 Tax=Mycena metata TaxID=1033252 RepID=A0AAD7KIJ4_9AGAR|nr:hypothetical protein B0H16DRAFT_1488777 [Mycena metata]
MSSFAPKPGCPMCSIVSKSVAPPNSPRSPSLSASKEPELLWHDDNFTAYREKANPVSSKGHIVIAFNLHVPSIYTLSSTDLPLLVNVRSLATRLLTSLLPPSSPIVTPMASTSAPLNNATAQFRIGFITPPLWDPKIPVTDHLHAHAYIGPGDLMGWYRKMVFGPVSWYAIDDLIAEIRESVSNNRIKSGYENRASAPIDRVADAGAASGTADGIETSEPGLANSDVDLEGGQATPTALVTPRTATSLAPPSSIPSIRV